MEENKNKYKNLTYGQRLEGFRSLSGIPDSFYSAEDPADRRELWEKYQKRKQEGNEETLAEIIERRLRERNA